MAFCPKCGHQLAENTRFCTHCGEKVAELTAVPQAAEEPQPAAAPVYAAPAAGKSAAKKTPLLFVLLGVLVLAVLVFAATRLFGKPATNADQELSTSGVIGNTADLTDSGSTEVDDSAARELESIVGSWYLVSGISGDVEFTLEDTPVDLFCLILWGDSTARLYIGTDYVDYAWSILEDGSLRLLVPETGAVLNAVIDGDMLTFENEDPNDYMWAQLQKGEPLYLDEGYYEEHSEPAAGGVQEGDSDGPVVDEPLTEEFLIGLWEAYQVYAYDEPSTLEEVCGGDMRVNFVADGGWCSIGGEVADITWSITEEQLNMTRGGYPFYGSRVGDELMLGFADEYGTVWFFLRMTGAPG